MLMKLSNKFQIGGYLRKLGNPNFQEYQESEVRIESTSKS